jgi:3-phosphoglycerate kinase
MDLRLPQDLPLAHQRVFLRCDFNVPLKNGIIYTIIFINIDNGDESKFRENIKRK